MGTAGKKQLHANALICPLPPAFHAAEASLPSFIKADMTMIQSLLKWVQDCRDLQLFNSSDQLSLLASEMSYPGR